MNAEILFKHFDRIAGTPDAVSRMRLFILDLALRGKLVEQNPAEESAEELLQRVRAENVAGIVKENRRTEAPGERNPAGAGNYEIPSGWALTTLGTVASKITDGTHKTPTYVLSGVPFVSVKDFSGGHLDLSNTRFITEEEHSQLYKRCDPKRGDILLGRIGTLGRAVLVDTDVEFSLFVSVGLIRFSHNCLHPDFFRLSLNSPFVAAEFNRIKVGGGTHTNKLNLGDMATIQIPLPPLAEQYRIVAKVDELMALYDRLEQVQREREIRRGQLTSATLRLLNDCADSQALRRNCRFFMTHLPRLTVRADQIRGIRKAVLDLAVTGKLVSQDLKDEPASALLARLVSSLRALKEGEPARNRKPTHTKVGGALGTVSFPESWETTIFDNVNSIASGVAKGKNLSGRKTTMLPYLRVANVQQGYLDLDVIKEIEIPIEEEGRYELKAGDVLMTEGGDWDKLGRAAIWNEEIPNCIHQNHIYRIRPANKRELLPAWIMLFANSSLGRSYFEDASKQTTNLASINMTQLRSCPLPLPPIAEQKRIISKVDELMGLCDRLDRELSNAAIDSRNLLEAVLRSSFAA